MAKLMRPRLCLHRARACESVWWLGLSSAISEKVENYPTCTRHRTTQRVPLLTTPVPEMLWQRVRTDIFTWEKKTCPVVVDCFSRYTEVAYLNVATASTVIAALKNIFGHHGVPEVLMSDNGPKYVCAHFKDFASEYGFTHLTSSPQYPQAN